MNSLTLSKMMASTSNIDYLRCPVTSSTTYCQYRLACATSIYMQIASTKTTFLKSTLSLNNLRFSPFVNGHSFCLVPFCKKETLVKKAPIWRRIVAEGANGQDSPNCKFPEKTSSNLKIDEAAVAKDKVAQRLKIGVYFAIWWSLNVVFNIYNKKVLNAYPFPWLTSTLSLASGSAIMLVSWALKIVKAPEVDCDFWKGLAPVALAHTIGHVAATISMSKVAVSFTHIIKSSEPAFTVIIQRLVFGQHFPLSVYVSLLPIIGGCGLAAATELNFNMTGVNGFCRCWWTGFMGAMISNIAFVFRNIFSKKGMSKCKNVGGINYYACLSIMSLVFLTPFAIAVEGPQAWRTGLEAAKFKYGNQILWWVVAQSVFYHLYNQVSYMSLNEISPLTFSIGNTMKRVTVIASSILIFHTKVLPVNAAGATIAIFGTFLYSQVNQ